LTTHLLGVALAGTGTAVPARVVPNAEFADRYGLDTSDEWISTRTGIRERRFAGPADTAATLGTTAARQALTAANLTATDLDLIAFATVTPDLMCPSCAALVQAQLGCRAIPAFDLSAACSGFLYGLGTATQFVRTGAARHALVIGAEVLSRTLDVTDRATCVLFGDGAGAVVLSAAPPGTRAGVRVIRLYSDGTGGDLIRVPSATAPAGGPARTEVQGREVFRFAVTRMAELIRQGTADARELGCEIDLLVPHQVNQRIIDAALGACGFPADRVMVNLDRYGNTSAASVPMALDEAIRTGRCGPGDTVLLVAFGGGLTWGGALVTL
jgi:3-oxoacyl-[acyl-carrier-protein] synthase-3